MFLLCDLSRNVVLNYIKISLGEEKGFCVCVCFFTRNALCFNTLCTQKMALSQYIEKVCAHSLMVCTRLGLLLSGFFMGPFSWEPALKSSSRHVPVNNCCPFLSCDRSQKNPC